MDEYQQKALESIAITGKGIDALAHRSLGLSGEAGIVANKIKKIIRDKDGEFDRGDLEFVKANLGDVQYYVAALAEHFDLSLSDIAKVNLKKSTEFKAAREK